MSGEESKQSLSKNIMKMKFMQRGVEADLREKQRQEREAMLKDSHWVVDASAEKTPVVIEDSTVVNASSARRTFGNFSSKPKPVHTTITPTQPPNAHNDKGKPNNGPRKQFGRTDDKSDSKSAMQQKKRKREDASAAEGEKKQKTATGSNLTAPKSSIQGKSQKEAAKSTNGKKSKKQQEEEEAEDEDKMDEDSDASDQRMLDAVMNMDSNEEVEGDISDGSSDDDEADEEIDDLDE